MRVPVFCHVISLILNFARLPRGSILSHTPLQSLVTLLSACLFCKVGAQRALDVPDGEKQEVSPAATLSSSDITSPAPDLFVFLALILSGFLKALVFAVSISQEPLLVLGCHLPGMIPSGLSLYVSLTGCPFFCFY